MKGSNLTLIHSMEEAVRTLLQNPDSLEGPKVDPLDLMKAYKVGTPPRWTPCRGGGARGAYPSASRSLSGRLIIIHQV